MSGYRHEWAGLGGGHDDVSGHATCLPTLADTEVFVQRATETKNPDDLLAVLVREFASQLAELGASIHDDASTCMSIALSELGRHAEVDLADGTWEFHEISVTCELLGDQFVQFVTAYSRMGWQRLNGGSTTVAGLACELRLSPAAVLIAVRAAFIWEVESRLLSGAATQRGGRRVAVPDAHVTSNREGVASALVAGAGWHQEVATGGRCRRHVRRIG